METGDNGCGMITSKLRKRGEVRNTMTVVVPEIILNGRGLDSDV